MKIKKGFTLAEILTSLAVVGTIGILAVGAFNSDTFQRREYMGRFQMIVPQLSEIAGLSAQNADYFDDWWAESNSLINLGCDSENPSVCLSLAFTSSSSKLTPCEDEDCFENRDNINNTITEVFGNLAGANIAEEMQVLEAPGSATYGLLYTDSSCRTRLRSNTGGIINACGAIFVDVNGRLGPNVVATADTVGDRFLLALTQDGVEQTILSNAAAGCPTGTTYNAQRRACEEEHVCSVSEDAVARAQEMVAANAENPSSVSISYPDGEEFENCITARCTLGVRPNADNLCPGSCPAGQEYAGGLFVSEGGDIDDELWEQKLCCTPIETQDDLRNISRDLNGTYCLMNDIELAGDWTPIAGVFTGRLFGNGYTISNLRINRRNLATTSRIGLFAINNGVIKDIIFENSRITVTTVNGNNWSYVGTIAGEARTNSNISNIIINNGAITTSGMQDRRGVGGVVGLGGNISNIKTNLTITDAGQPLSKMYHIGGVTGEGGRINNVLTNGEITVSPSNSASTLYAGGISGIGNATNKQTVNNAINNANITINPSNNTTTSDIGGIIGRFHLNTTDSLNSAINLGSITTSNIPNGQFGIIAGDVINTTNITNAISAGTSNSAIPLFGNWRPANIPNSIFYLTGSALRFANTANATRDNTTRKNGAQLDAILNRANLPPQLIRDCRNLDGAGNPPADCYDVLNTPNSFIPNGDDNISLWAYRMPPYAAGFDMVQDALVLRWQCQPYKPAANGGLECCRPSYANWEPALDICPAP